MVKITDNYLDDKASFNKIGIKVPTYDTKGRASHTKWVHFGGGNLFRAFHAAIADRLLALREIDSGVVVVDTYDEDVIDKAYKHYNNRILRVITKADGSLDKELFASVSNALFFSSERPDDWDKLFTIFKTPELQVVSFSITEKGYRLRAKDGQFSRAVAEDLKNGPGQLKNNMTALVALLYARYQAGAYPLALLSTDNFSRNGDRLKETVLTIAKEWLNNKKVTQGFVDFLEDDKKISYPLSMIDRITPNPSDIIAGELKSVGFEDYQIIHSPKHTNIAAFSNTEENHYLVIEDDFPNGRPAFEKAGVIMTDRQTVNDADEMKVTTCLNPLHTAMAVYGSLLGFHSISSEVQDKDILQLIKQIGYVEGLPVVKDPKVINPRSFIDELIQKRLPNPYIPDTPQRIATDTSQKIAIRYGVTIQHYLDNPDLDVNSLTFIPLVLATWCRYLLGIDDQGVAFTPSPDPLLADLQKCLEGIRLGETKEVHSYLQPILSNRTIFGHDLYEIGIGDKVESFFTIQIVGKGAVRRTLKEVLGNCAKK